MTQPPDANAKINCDLCGGPCESRGTYTVLGKHRVEFWQCVECGYGFLKNPTWLEEAYASAITSVDIGPLNRCLEQSRMVKMLIDLFHLPAGRGLDYGGGYGLFTRRMRDLGYPFLWHDTYCPNLLAKGFEGTLDGTERYGVITAFEVLEHLVSPKQDLDQIISACDSFIFSTLLVPEPFPKFNEWWYFAPEHGQHVSFYTKRALETLARKHGKHFTSNGSDFHMISSKQVNPRLFRLATKRRIGALFELLRPKPSLLTADFDAGRKRALSATTPGALMEKK